MLTGSFSGEETLPLLQPLGEQREEGGEGKRGAAKHRLLGRNNYIQNSIPRGNMMNKHHPSPSSASNALNVRSQPHFEHLSRSASVAMQKEECKQIPLSSSSVSCSSSLLSASPSNSSF